MSAVFQAAAELTVARQLNNHVTPTIPQNSQAHVAAASVEPW